MRRFFQSSPPNADGTLVLEGSEASHAVKVIRLRVGDHAVVIDGAGGEFVCVARQVDRRHVLFSVEEQMTHPNPRTQLKLFQSITKGKSFELVLQKAVELGATEVVPVLSARVVAKFTERETKDKAGKWKQIAIEAIKQCGAPWLPKICSPVSLSDAVELDRSTELRTVGSLQAVTTYPRTLIEEFHRNNRRSPASISIWIGPEGDFTEEEYQMLNHSGVISVSFGKRVLRSETAALYALSIFGYELSNPR